MTEQAIESIAIPVIENVVKELEPEAKVILADIQAHVVNGLHALEAKLPGVIAAAEGDASQVISSLVELAKGVVQRTEVHIGITPTADPTSAVPAPQQ